MVFDFLFVSSSADSEQLKIDIIANFPDGSWLFVIIELELIVRNEVERQNIEILTQDPPLYSLA